MMSSTKIIVEFAAMFESGRRAVVSDLRRNLERSDGLDGDMHASQWSGWLRVRRIVGAGLAESINGCQKVASELGVAEIPLTDMAEMCKWVSIFGCAIMEAQDIADDLEEDFEEPESTIHG